MFIPFEFRIRIILIYEINIPYQSTVCQVLFLKFQIFWFNINILHIIASGK